MTDWLVGSARCTVCGVKWISVYPDGTDTTTLCCPWCRAEESMARTLRRVDNVTTARAIKAEMVK